MNTKCHYNGPEFVPCEKLKIQLDNLSIEAHDYALYRIEHSGIECGFCGASLANPEEGKVDKPWWVVPGMAIKDRISNSAGYRGVYIIDKDNIYNFTENWFEFLPFGGPFDMVPEWATLIEFYDMDHYKSDQGGMFMGDSKDLYFPIWHNCPEEFTGKTFSLEGLK